MNILVFIINFILASCNYTCRVLDFNLGIDSTMVETRTQIHTFLYTTGVIHHTQSLRDFLQRENVQLALHNPIFDEDIR